MTIPNKSSISSSIIDGDISSLEKQLNVSYKNFCESYRRREDTLTLVHQLHQMIKAVQRHRGISMGLLAGDQEFLEEFNALQYQLERRLATLEMFAYCTGGLLSDREKENLHHAWITIRQNWQDDELSDNFELHSHFIHQLLAMVFSLAKSLETPLSEKMEEPQESDASSVTYPRVFRRIELLSFIARQMPEMIEQTAKLRGLSTYAASAAKPEEALLRKLRYVLQVTQQQSERVRQQAERLHVILSGEVPSLKDIKNFELKLMFLINTIENDILLGAGERPNSHQLFSLATEIIDVYWKVVNDGLILVRKWHQDDLDVWAKTSV